MTANSNEEEIKLFKILNNDLDSPESKIVSSCLRRAISTVTMTFSKRLQRSPNESILILPSLQEISRNPDSLSITPPYTQVTSSWFDKNLDSDLQEEYNTKNDSSKKKQVDIQYHSGNKPIDTNGLKRMNEFCHFVFSSVLPQKYIIVGGHTVWFKSFFKTYINHDIDHICKQKNISYGGCVAFDLFKNMSDRGEMFMVDEKSIRVIYGGFN